ncbi:MAG TPA: Holliday junction branch migration protein RuvA [Clostridiales bacterium]|mgnify:CR=1 FL=1|nr:Holliday junction branch migration protein RuvA [Clostridiales bacterium]
MFAYIKGKIQHVAKDFFIMEVNGLGFKIWSDATTLGKLNSVKEPIKVYTYLHVREDTMALFGFLSDEELKLFEEIINVSGIGPKVGLSILSTMTPSQFTTSLLANDIKSLTKVPGVGKKTAQRIIFELRDKIKQRDMMPSYDMLQQVDDNRSEVLSALTTLGYTAQEAEKAVARVYKGEYDIETLLKLALSELSNIK